MTFQIRPCGLLDESTEGQLDYWRRATEPQVTRTRMGLYRAAGEPLPVGGGAPQLPTVLATLDAAFTANTYTAAQTIIGPKVTGPFSADYFKTLGASWEVEAVGVMSSSATPTFVIGTYYGVLASTITTILNVTAAQTTISGLANIPWYWRGFGHTRATSGATATILATGVLFGQVATAAAGNNTIFSVNATPPTAVTCDMSSASFLDLKGTWSASNASNTTTVNYYRLMSLSS